MNSSSSPLSYHSVYLIIYIILIDSIDTLIFIARDLTFLSSDQLLYMITKSLLSIVNNSILIFKNSSSYLTIRRRLCRSIDSLNISSKTDTADINKLYIENKIKTLLSLGYSNRFNSLLLLFDKYSV